MPGAPRDTERSFRVVNTEVLGDLDKHSSLEWQKQKPENKKEGDSKHKLTLECC